MGERSALPLRHAVALGLLHGPGELLPISSSGHTALVPWLARWPYRELEPELRKSFEVALHAGTAAALLVRPPGARLEGRAAFLAPAVIPPALAGYALGAQIEGKLGTPATIAGGLLAGSLAMIAAELHPGTARAVEGANARDGLMVGLAQTCALMPGVSRSGATLAAARTRGFSPADADRLSWAVGLPLIAGAGLLKGIRLAHARTPRALRLSFAAGAAGAFVSTLASAGIFSPARRTALLPACIVYRVALALFVIRRMRDTAGWNVPIPKK